MGQNGSVGYTLHPHVQADDKEQVQSNIQQGRDHQKIEGTIRVAYCTENTRAHIVQHQAQTASKIDGQVGSGFRDGLEISFHQLEHCWNDQNAYDGQNNA